MLKVLVAPLDWGLGHATRCIPIIKELVNQGCTVIIAASGPQKILLQEEFPTLRFVEIPGYRVKYGKNRALTILQLIVSLPKILIRIKQENRWLRRFSRLEQPDLVLSDNRYGLYRRGIVCVFITHQLFIRTPFGAATDWLLQRINYSAIRHFSCCWVPDIPGPDSLAGELSHPRNMPSIPTRYIGWLSRFGAAGAAELSADVTDAVVTGVMDYDLLVLLSGPEPQRTILEKMILEQAAGSGYKIALVRGLPGRGLRVGASGGGLAGGGLAGAPPGIAVHDHLPAGELEVLIRRSEVVLSRSGYSTVMDLVRLRRRAVYIPTPGQTEQEYLGKYLAERRLAICVEQRGFSLQDALIKAQDLRVRPAVENGLLKNEIKILLERVSAPWAGGGRAQSAVADLG
jgi:hypothetical protein